MPRAPKTPPSTPSSAADASDDAGTRARLLQASIRLFGAKGYAATSVRDIVRTAGVTAPTLYHHFGNKEGIYRAIARAGRERFAQAWQEARAGGGSASERIGRLCRVHFRRQRDSAHLRWAIERLMSDPMHAAPSVDFRALALERVRHFEELVKEGVRTGEFRECVPRHVALALVGAIETASRPYLSEADIDRSDEELEGMLKVILSGIAPRRAITAKATRGKRTDEGRT
jgi:AcrR family transcriptional regulator